jgi:hypothetical protein
MSGVATAIVGSAVVGAYAAKKSGDAQADAAGKAANAEVQSNRENIAFQKEVFQQQREDNAPWREVGAASLEQLNQGVQSGEFQPGEFNFKFKEDPGYQFRKQEGINALDASASARGRLKSGAQQRAVTRFGSNLASQEYGNAFNRSLTEYKTDASRKQGQFNRLASLSNVGQVANSADQAARSEMASNVSASTTASGNALARGAINKGNARASAYQGIGQSINQGAQNYLLYDALG